LGARKLLVMLQPFMDMHGLCIGRDMFFELLRVNGLLIRRRRQQRPRTTFSLHRFRKYPDLAKGLTITRKEQLWVSDITYINLTKGFAYLSLVTDVYSHKIVGYYLSNDLGTEGCIAALTAAIRSRVTDQPLLHHSDRGSQYCADAYVKLLGSNSINISMTQTGDPRDNAIAERVNGILKQELLRNIYPGIRQARQEVSTAIDIYNRIRPHSSIDMMTPEKAHSHTGYIPRRWKTAAKTAQRKEVS